jgi:uncharacterized membrane protein YhiD involved in acid resistance
VPAVDADWHAVIAGLTRLSPAAVMITNWLVSGLTRAAREWAAAANPRNFSAVAE